MDSNKVLRKYLVPLVYLATLAVNGLASYLPLNNQTTGAISDSFPIYFVPAGYVFSIWGLIYLLTGWYAFYQSRKGLDNNHLNTVANYFIIGSLANITWLFLWHYNYPQLSTVPMVVLFISLIMAFKAAGRAIAENATLNTWAIRTPFSVYLGWISVALTANISITLYVANWNGWRISGPVWVAILSIIIAIITITILVRENAYAYALVIIWALVGIYVKFPNESAIALSTLPLSALIGLATVTVWARSRGGFVSEMVN